MFFFVFHLNYFELTTFVDRQTPSRDIVLVILNKSFAVQFFLCKLASVGQLSQTLSSLSTIQGSELIAEVRRSPSNELIFSDSRNQLFRSNFIHFSPFQCFCLCDYLKGKKILADKLSLLRGQCLFNYNVINFNMQYIKPFAKLSLPLLFVFYSFSIRISFPSLFLSKTHQSAFNSNLSPPIRMQIWRFILSLS